MKWNNHFNFIPGICLHNALQHDVLKHLNSAIQFSSSSPNVCKPHHYRQHEKEILLTHVLCQYRSLLHGQEDKNVCVNHRK